MTEPLLPVGLQAIEKARSRIAGTIITTPTVGSPSLGEHAQLPVHLKLEHLQTTGSFKLRGAANAVAALNETQRRCGVVAASTGNHGRALAHAANTAGIRCIVCLSRLVPAVKVEAIQALGAEVRVVGHSQDDAQVEVDRLVSDEGLTMIPPFDNREVIAGQGTAGLEMLEQVPDLQQVLVPLSGGGLISGVAAAIKARRPTVRIVGITMERGAAMQASLKAGKPVMVKEVPTLADSLGGGIGSGNRFTFTMTRELVDDVILVSEAEIAAAIGHLYWKERQIVEGAGSVGVAALLAGKITLSGPLVILISGGNIDMHQHYRILSGEADDVARQLS